MPRLLLLTLLSFVMATVCGCGGDAATSSSPSQENAAPASRQFDTPEAVYVAMVEATKNKDYKTMAELSTPDTQALMAGGMIFGAGFMTIEDENKEKELKELLGRHGIDMDDEAEPPADMSPEEAMKAMVEPVEDLPTFIDEIMTWMDKNSDDDSGGFAELGELGEVTVDGDSASAGGETDQGPQPIEFRKLDGSWRVHLPMDGPGGGDMPPELGLEEPEDDGTPGLGTLWYGDKAVKLQHAMAYKSKFFDDPCTVVLLTARPTSERDLNNLKKMLTEEGNDDAFFARGPHVKLSLDENGELMFMFAWIDNMSINSNSGVEVDIQIEGDRVQGSADMPEAQEIADEEYRFEATFDVELMQPE